MKTHHVLCERFSYSVGLVKEDHKTRIQIISFLRDAEPRAAAAAERTKECLDYAQPPARRTHACMHETKRFPGLGSQANSPPQPLTLPMVKRGYTLYTIDQCTTKQQKSILCRILISQHCFALKCLHPFEQASLRR